MRKRERFFLAFFVVLLLSLLLFGGAKLGVLSPVQSFLETLTAPVQRTMYYLPQGAGRLFANKKIQSLEEEVRKLQVQLVQQQQLIRENNALRDQFQTARIKSSALLPAAVVGAPRFLPVITASEELIIDKGITDGVKVGQAVVVKDVIVGKIIKTSAHLSVVLLVTNSASSLSARTTQGALGIVKGQGNGEMTLENVLLSETLQPGDVVATAGDLDSQGLGYPPGLVVGEIESVNKKPSALFQTAALQTSLDVNRLSTVFIVMEALQ